MQAFLYSCLISVVLAADADKYHRRIIAMATMPPDSQCTYTPPPSNCETSCGMGNVPCVNNTRCYNPSLGEVCCQDGKYCPRNTYCTDVGCCSIYYTLEQCGAREIQVYPPLSSSSSKRQLTSTSTSSVRPSSASASVSESSAQSTSKDSPKGENSDGNGVSRKTSAIIGGVIGGLVVIGAAVVGVAWLIIRAKPKAGAAPTVTGSEDDAHTMDTKTDGDGEAREAATRSVIGYYAPASGLPLALGTPFTPFQGQVAPRRVTELDAQGIYCNNPSSTSTLNVANGDMSKASKSTMLHQTK